MPKNWTFQLATRIEFGRGALRRLGETAGEFGRRAVLLTYREPGRLEDACRRAEKAFAAAGIEAARWPVVEPEPTLDQLLTLADDLRRTAPDMIVGLGGGSVLDMAKGLAALARQPAVFDGDATGLTDALPVIAVPTTAGTGSEVSSVAVFHRRLPGGNVKKETLQGPAITPRIAVVDPDLTIGTPAALTAAAGADALGHAIEASLSRKAGPITSLLAARAAGLLVENLPLAVAEPESPGPREPLALAAVLAGAAFDDAGVTVGHALAHGLGAVLGIPHALAVAIATPRNLRFNAGSIEPLAALAEACGQHTGSTDEKADWFIRRIESLLSSLGLPSVAASEGIQSELLDRLAASAVESTRSGITLNPRKVDNESLRQLFAECLGR